MPLTVVVDHQRHEVTTVALGAITLSEILDHLNDERRAGGLAYRELVDATGATASFGASHARVIVQRLRELGKSGALGPTAVLVANDVTYGMGRMLQILLEDVAKLRPFHADERTQAETWLEAEK